MNQVTIYSQDEIDNIKTYIKHRGYANNYTEPTWHLVSTLTWMFGLLYAIHIANDFNMKLISLLALVLMRLFMIFHDMCHRSFFPTNERSKNIKGFNYQVASLIEQWCLFSAEYWNKTHSKHHGALGNIDEHDGTRTVIISSEYEKLHKHQKWVYKMIRFPPLFFLIVPIYVYWIGRIMQREWIYIAKYSAWLKFLYKIGSWKLMASFIFAQYLGGFVGVMMFHLQHQVNDGYWKHFNNTDKLARANADLNGSTVLTIPWFLEYFTNGIEYHNVHHIDPGVPSYNIKRIYYELVDNKLIPDEKVDYWKQFVSLWNTLYDEKTEKYI